MSLPDAGSPGAVTRGFRAYLLLTLLSLAVFVPGTTTIPVLDRDEARFAQATKQMFETGDFIGIYYQGNPRNKKPVGIHWLQAAAVEAFSDPASPEIWPYRLPSAIGAWIAVLLAYALGRRLLGRRTALLGAAFLATSIGVIAETNLSKTDGMLLACVVACQLVLARTWWDGRLAKEAGLDPPRQPWWTTWLFWGSLGVSILLKGPIAPVVIGLTVVGLLIATRTGKWLRALRPLVGFAIMIAIAAPWFVLVTVLTSTGFVEEALFNDLIPKILGAVESHGGPPGTYLLTMIVSFWPASVFVVPALVTAFRMRKEPAVTFLLAWLVPSWILFEIVPTKLPHYTLPTYPALAMLTAIGVLSAIDGGAPAFRALYARIWYVIWALIGVAVAGFSIYAAVRFGDGALVWAILSAAAILLASAAGFPLAWRGRFGRAVPALLAGAVVWVFVTGFFLAPALDRIWISRQVNDWLEANATRPFALASVDYHEPSLVFMLGTGTELTEIEGAARFLESHPGGFALAPEQDTAALEASLGDAAGRLHRIKTFEGMNYSNGREMSLGLYRLEPAG